jgi:NAD(P)-dependent dehydrogenase (short-subunit alcohol dehydrogenase family)
MPSRPADAVASRMSDLFDVAGRAALVTGASSGLGRHFARTLAARGAPVALAARREAPLAALAREIADAGGAAVVVPMDVTSAQSVAAGVVAAEQALGPLRILVNNSGIATTAPVLGSSDRDWDDVIDTNLRGAFLVARETARSMAAGDGGSIINIASILAYRVVPGLAAYAASKAGLRHLTEAMSLELARHGVRVNAIAPGYIATDMNQEFFDSDAGKAMIKRIPQRRLGQPSDLDGALLLLASNASAYMTGATLIVDGGHLNSSL